MTSLGRLSDWCTCSYWCNFCKPKHAEHVNKGRYTAREKERQKGDGGQKGNKSRALTANMSAPAAEIVGYNSCTVKNMWGRVPNYIKYCRCLQR